MRLFVLGATGRTGGELVDLALGRGHDVTAFGRSTQRMSARRGLRLVQGDPKSRADLEVALPDHHAVVSAIGPKPRDALRPCTLLTDVAASTVAAMRSAGVSRLGIVSAAVLFNERGLRHAFFRWLLKHHRKDLAAMEAIVGASGLAWTLARPPRLIKSPEERYRATPDALPANGSFSTSFRSVAAFLLDAIEQRRHIGEIVGVAQ